MRLLPPASLCLLLLALAAPCFAAPAAAPDTHHIAMHLVGKHPRIGDYREKATTDIGQIEKWWNDWPDANIGIATGGDSRLFVIDEDGVITHALYNVRATGHVGRLRALLGV